LIAHRHWLLIANGEDNAQPSLNQLLRQAKIDWHGVRLGAPDWSRESHSIACTLQAGSPRVPIWLHVMFNAYWEALDFELPAIPGSVMAAWRRWVDTSRESPEDITEIAAAPIVKKKQYHVAPRSVVTLFVQASPRSGPAIEVANSDIANAASA
jgi:glycogen operon protein